MAPALAPLKCRVIQSTSDEAPGLLAYVDHYLEAHHSPDLFHVQHELVKAVSGPMASKERAAQKAVIQAKAQLEQLQSNPQDGASKDLLTLEQAEQALDTARHEHVRLAAQREQVRVSIRGIGHDYHFVDLERGVRRNRQLIPRMSRRISSRFAPLPSKKASARAAWSASTKPIGWCPKCK